MSPPVYTFVEPVPASWRGLTGGLGGTPIHSIGILAFDGTYHQFLLTDHDLYSMVRSIAARFPGSILPPVEDQERASLHSASDPGSRTDRVFPHGPLSSAASASSEVRP